MHSLITIIIPTYNYACFISEAIDSVLSQTYTHWECYIVDDGSTDNTSDVVDQYTSIDTRIHFIRQENAGPAAARNNGIKHSNGEFIQFLDADDLIASDKIRQQLSFLESNPTVDIVYGDMRYFRSEAPIDLLYSMFEPDMPWMPMASGVGREILLPLLSQNIMVSNAPLIRRSVIHDVGLFDETLEALEDWQYWLRCANLNKRFEFKDFPDGLALVRLHRSSTSQSGRRSINPSTIFDMWNKTTLVLTDSDLSILHQNTIASSETRMVAEKIKEASLFKSVIDIAKMGMKHQRYKWIVKQLALAVIRHLSLRP